jgi:ribosomal protein L22
MAEEKKDTEKKQSSTRRSTAKKSSGSTGGTRKTAAKPAAKKPATKKPAAKKPAAKTADKETAPKKPAAKKPAAAKKDQAETKAKEPAKAPARKRAAKKEAPERPVVNARARFVRVAPRKARLVADQVRGLPLEDALPLLRFSTRSAAQDIRKLLESAAANAETNHDLVADDLLIKDIHVDEGPTLRRYRPRALGRATRINKRTSHIAVALTPED